MMSSKLTNRALKGLVGNKFASLKAFSSQNIQMERQQQQDKDLKSNKVSMTNNDEVRFLYEIPQEYYEKKREDSHRTKSSSWYRKGIASLLVIPFAFSMQTAFALTNNTSDEKSVVMMTSSLQLPSPSISQVYSKDFLRTQNSSLMLKNVDSILKKESLSLSLPQSVSQNMCPSGLLDANVSKSGSSCLLKNSSLQFPANSPIEDSFAVKQFKNRPDLLYAAVFDGHSGFQLAHYAMNNLHEQIDENFLKYGKNIHDVIYHSFDQIDQSFKKVAKQLFFNGWHGAGEIGSCALVTIFDKANSKLICANSGDCMAVKLSMKNDSKDYKPTLLSYAYSANNLEEQEKYRKMYPNEPDIIYCRSQGDCYIKNRRQPTKAFGNYQIRDKEFNFHSFSKNFGYKSPIVEMKQQYVDHVPEIRQFDITPQDEFVVLATDGLWDQMDEVQVAQIVSKVVQEKRVQKNETNLKDLIMKRLLVRSLEKAAARNNMTLDELMKIKTPARRNLHDDVTIVVVDLKNDLN